MNESQLRLLTIDEVAERLRRTPGQLRWMVSQHTAPPSAKIGGRRFFREADVDRFIDEAFAKQAS